MENDIWTRLEERAGRVRGYIASSEIVVALLQPEMDKFDARTGHDIYTVRMAVDHESSIRTQTKEATELEEAAAAGRALEARVAELEAENALLGCAVMAVVSATRAYLPPDGITAQECINMVLEATDNPAINPLILQLEAVTLSEGSALNIEPSENDHG